MSVGFGLALLVYMIAYLGSPQDWQLFTEEGPRGGYADYLALFTSFLPMFIVPFLVWRYLNGLSMLRLVTVAARIRWSMMARAACVVFIVYAVTTAVEYRLDPDAFEGMARQTDWAGWIVLTLITLVFCPIQAASEEIFVRGYAAHTIVKLASALRINRFIGIWLAYIVTSLCFAWLHAANPEAEGQFWPYMVSTGAYGLAMCVLLHMEGGLESAIGYHIANNIFVFSIFGYADPELPNSAVFWMPDISIVWIDVVIETLWMAALVTVILWWNRRAARS